MNELTPTQAHDIVNKEINVILEGCGIDFCGILMYHRHKTVEDTLCLECNAKLKGIISMEASEIEFLDKPHLLSRDVKKRLQALKISIKDLKEKVK